MILLTALLVACSPAEPLPVARPTATPSVVSSVVIGAIFDMGEDAGPSGRQRQEAASLAIELVNRRGGLRLPTGERRPLELRVYDDAGGPERAALSVRRLSEDGAVAVIGPSAPESVLAGRRTAEQVSIPLIALDGGGSDPAQAWHWSFAMAAPVEEPLSAVLGFFLASGVDRFAWMAPRTLEAASLGQAMRRMSTGAGMQIVGEETYTPGEEEYVERLTRLQAGDPRVILAWVRDPHEAAAIAMEARTIKDLVPVFFGPAASAPTTLSLAGEAGTGMRTVTLRLPVADDLWDHDPLTPVIRDFRRELQAKTGRPPTAEAAGAWDAVRLLVTVLERSGLDRAAVRNGLEGTSEYLGASGAITFGPKLHHGLDKRAFIVARGEGQRWRLPP